MSDDVKDGVDTQKQENAAATFTEEQFIELQEKLKVAEANLEKARKGENFNRTKRLELEKTLAEMPKSEEIQNQLIAKSKELDELRQTIANREIDTALKSAIEKSGAKAEAASTLLKLVDRSKIAVIDGQVDTKTIDEAINELKKTDAVLFEPMKTTSLKLAGESKVTDGFRNEIAAAKTKDEWLAVMKKYGIKSTI